LRKQLFRESVDLLKELKSEREKIMFSLGRPCWKSKKLHPVTSMLNTESELVQDCSQWASMVQSYFNHILKRSDPHLGPLIDDRLLQHSGCGIKVTAAAAAEAVKALRTPSLPDGFECCPARLLLFAQVSSQYLADV